MTPRLDAHMEHPAVAEAQAAEDAHLLACEDCRDVVHQRDLCEEGARLHDAAVLASRSAYEELHG